MKVDKSLSRTIVDSEGKEIPKTIQDYTGEELDQLAEEDPEYEESLWDAAELDAINNPDNHDKSK